MFQNAYTTDLFKIQYQKPLSVSEFYGDLVYNLKKDKGREVLSDRLKQVDQWATIAHLRVIINL